MNHQPNNFTEKNVHISTIVGGDTVIHNGELKTVCFKDIKHGGFMGSSLFGDSYTLGRTPVRKVTFILLN